MSSIGSLSVSPMLNKHSDLTNNFCRSTVIEKAVYWSHHDNSNLKKASAIFSTILISCTIIGLPLAYRLLQEYKGQSRLKEFSTILTANPNATIEDLSKLPSKGGWFVPPTVRIVKEGNNYIAKILTEQKGIQLVTVSIDLRYIKNPNTIDKTARELAVGMPELCDLGYFKGILGQAPIKESLYVGMETTGPLVRERWTAINLSPYKGTALDYPRLALRYIAWSPLAAVNATMNYLNRNGYFDHK